MYRDKVTDVFFDLDHTLWDFERNSALTFEKILGEHGLALSLPDFLKIYIPLNHSFWKMYREERITQEELRYQRLKQTFDGLKMQVADTAIHSLSEAYIANLSNFGHVIPHALEILEYLKPNYRIHIITNGFHEIQGKKLKNSGIDAYFEHVVDSEMAGVKKPNPKIFHLALDKAGATPQRSLMIGDNLEADILGARAIGMNTIHFNSNGEGHHTICQIITTLDEIKQFL